MTRPRSKDHPRSYVLVWRGTEPIVRVSHWAADYTPGHRETPADAIVQGGVDLLEEIARLREKWVKLQLLAVQEQANLTAIDSFGQLDNLPGQAPS